MKNTRTSVTLLSTFLTMNLLIGCAEKLPPTKVELLPPPAHKMMAQSVIQPIEFNSLELISEEERMLALQGKASEFNHMEKAHIDALTAYIEKYQVDPVMFEYVEKAKQEKAKKCAKVAGFYQAMPEKYIIVSELSKDYSYTCPYVVARFINLLESNTQ